jgi:hypothetical protein
MIGESSFGHIATPELYSEYELYPSMPVYILAGAEDILASSEYFPG